MDCSVLLHRWRVGRRNFFYKDSSSEYGAFLWKILFDIEKNCIFAVINSSIIYYLI